LSAVIRLEIAGGIVTAHSGVNGAGIGSGHGELGNSTVDEVVITGGKIAAYGNAFGAGIGTAIGQEGVSAIGDLLIGKATIFASGTHGAGIGSGFGDSGTSIVRNLVIDGATITAVGRDAAGIGSGYAQSGKSAIDVLTIANTVGNVTSLSNGAGVGAGYGFHGNSSIGQLTLRGDNSLSAVAVLDGAGIGAANGWFGTSMVGALVIDGGEYVAVGDHAAGIGAGFDSGGNSTVANLVLRNGVVRTVGIVGIGSSPYGQVQRLEIDGSDYGVVELECHSSSQYCLNGTLIAAAYAHIIATTNTSTFIDPVYGSDTDFGELHLSGFYRVKSLKDSFGSAVLLHFGQIDGRGTGLHQIAVVRQESAYSRTVNFDGQSVVGLTLSVEMRGSYTVTMTHNGKQKELCPNGNKESIFIVGAGETFVPRVAECGSEIEDVKKLSDGAKVGIAMAVIVVATCAAIAAFIVLKRRGVTFGGSELFDSREENLLYTE
jgi:hypothetical protein